MPIFCVLSFPRLFGQVASMAEGKKKEKICKLFQFLQFKYFLSPLSSRVSFSCSTITLMRRDNFRKDLRSVRPLWTFLSSDERERTRPCSTSTDCLVQRKQLAGRKSCCWVFSISFHSYLFISLSITLLALWPGKQLQSGLVPSVALVFLQLRKRLYFNFSLIENIGFKRPGFKSRS